MPELLENDQRFRQCLDRILCAVVDQLHFALSLSFLTNFNQLFPVKTSIHRLSRTSITAGSKQKFIKSRGAKLPFITSQLLNSFIHHLLLK